MRRTLDGRVVVVTGASSGIGRATAVEFARRGARVVAMARREEPLRSLAEQCAALPGDVLASPADVCDADALAHAARAAVERFGRLDVWVNNAAVASFGRFGEEPLAHDRRVVEVNVLGYLHGARAAMPWFREQGQGTLVNVGSVLSLVPAPFLTPYVMSKHAVRALSACLRTEVADVPGIRVCTVMPGSVDTPLFEHAANSTGWRVVPMRPIYSPERVARAVVACATRKRRDVVVGWMPRLAAAQYAVTPRLVERLAARAVARGHFGDQAADPTDGNLFTPMPAGVTTHGGWTAGPARRATCAAGVAILVAAGATRRWR